MNAGSNAPDLSNPPVIYPGLIIFDGPIGAGKTTLIEHLKNELVQSGARVKVIDETIPEDLDTYYKDPARKVFDFQKKFLLTLFDKWRDIFTTCASAFREYDFILCDRYWASTRAFVRYHYDKGNISVGEFKQLTNIINLFISVCPLLPEFYIFLDEKNTDCLERIYQRGRPGEKEVGDEYLQEVNEYIRRYNAFPFFGEGDASSMLELLDPKAASFVCPRPVMARFSQRVKCIHLTGVTENTTKGRMLPEQAPIELGADLIRANPLTQATRHYLCEEAAIIASTGKLTKDVIKASSK